MKTTLKSMWTWLRRREGLALDEAVLVITMLASFGTFMAVTVSWDAVLGNKPKHIQLAGLLTEIQHANTEFHLRHRMWPHQATDGHWGNNAAALVTPSAMRFPYRTMSNTFDNLLPDFTVQSGSGMLQHTFGSGGNIMQRAVSHRGSEYMEIILQNVPFEIAQRLDEEIDGTYNPSSGRVSMVFSDNRIDVHYRANKIK